MSDEVGGIDVVSNDKHPTDMPKIHSPFVREENEEGHYVVTPEVAEGYEWVFEDDDVMAIEKLHGTNVSIVVEAGNITAVYNRDNRIPPYGKDRQFITKAILNSLNRGYTELPDGQWFGEVIGPKLHKNPHNVEEHVWIPFQTYARDKLQYTSWGKYPKTFESISEWFRKGLFSLFWCRWHGVSIDEAMENGFCEGVMFTHPDGRMAKLRRDMFEWYYE